MKTLLIILCVCFLCTGDDPPRKKKKLKEDSTAVEMQQQRSINIEDLEKLNKMFDSLIMKQDTLIKKKK